MPSRRLRPDRCAACGGPADLDAVDNHCHPYKGCRSCRIMTMDEINARQAASKKVPHA